MNFKKYLEISLDKAKIYLESAFNSKRPEDVRERLEEMEKIEFCIDALEDWKTYWADEDQTYYPEEDQDLEEKTHEN